MWKKEPDLPFGVKKVNCAVFQDELWAFGFNKKHQSEAVVYDFAERSWRTEKVPWETYDAEATSETAVVQGSLLVVTIFGTTDFEGANVHVSLSRKIATCS